LIFIHFKKTFPIAFSSIFKLSPNPSFKGILHKLTIEGIWPIKKMNKWWNHFPSYSIHNHSIQRINPQAMHNMNSIHSFS
jgi:hypothetical protein